TLVGGAVAIGGGSGTGGGTSTVATVGGGGGGAATWGRRAASAARTIAAPTTRPPAPRPTRSPFLDAFGGAPVCPHAAAVAIGTVAGGVIRGFGTRMLAACGLGAFVEARMRSTASSPRGDAWRASSSASARAEG